MKGEYENISKETAVQKEVVEIKPPEVTMEDMNIMKRMIFDMKEFTIQTDNFVREKLLTKLEINNTAVEDVHTLVKNLNAKYGAFKGTTEKLEANIREQLDII